MAARDGRLVLTHDGAWRCIVAHSGAWRRMAVHGGAGWLQFYPSLNPHESRNAQTDNYKL